MITTETVREDDDLLAGARNLVTYVGIKSGQEVLIHTEPKFDDPDIIENLRKAITEVGAHVNVLHTRHWDKQTEPPPRVFLKALDGTDVLIGQGEYLHTKNHYLQVALFEKGLIYINNEAKTREALSSMYGRYPAELLFAIGDSVMKQVASAHKLRVTTEAGTDIRCRVLPETVGGYCYPFKHDSPGYKKGFPGGVSCFHPEDPVEGELVVEAFSPGLGSPKVILDEPLRLTYKNHRVKEMKGDCADWLSDYWKEYGDRNSSWMAECMWGIHPKASGKGGRGASNPHLMHFGLGNSIPYGGPAYSKTWIIVFVQDATLMADDKPVLERGHLKALEDDEVRSVAAKYENPDELLSQFDVSIKENFGGRTR
jgi:hypothetical protein